MYHDDLFSILQAFAALSPVKYLKWPSYASIDELQGFLVEQLICSEHFRLYPSSQSYQKSFWKWVIAKIEERSEEVREDIYSQYLALLDQSSIDTVSLARAPTPSYVTYLWKDTPQDPGERSAQAKYDFRKCTLFEARTTIESGTTGLRTWSASFVLAEYLMPNRYLVESSRILELGSGAGFLAIILAQLQVAEFNRTSSPSLEARGELPSLCLTDVDEQVLKRCESNVKLPCNNIASHPELRFKLLDWTDALDGTRRSNSAALFEEASADLLLGADLIYDVSIVPALVATLQLFLTTNSTKSRRKQVIIAATLRNEDTLDEFAKKVQDAHLRKEDIEVDQDSYSSRFLRSQPDAMGESKSCVKLFLITGKGDDL